MARATGEALFRAFRDIWKRDGWVRPYLSRYRGVLAAAVGLSVVAYLFAAALMFTSGYMISLAATIPFTVLALHLPSIFVRIFGIGKPLIQYVERLASHDWVLRMTSSLRRRLYEAVEAASDRAERSSYGRTLSLFASDIEHVQDLYLRTVLPLVAMLLVYAVVVVALGVFSPAMALMFLVAIGFVAVVLPLWSVAANGVRVERRQALTARMYDGAVESVIGAGEWRLSGRREDFMAALSEPYERRHALTRETRRFERRCALGRQAVFALAISALFLWCAWVFGSGAPSPDGFTATGAAQALGGAAMHDSVPHAANWIAAFILCAFPLLEVFAPATEAALGFVRHEGAIRELNRLDGEGAGAVPSGMSRGGSSVSTATAAAGAHDSAAVADAAHIADDSGVEEAAGMPGVPPDAALVLRGVRFAYDGGPTVLDSVSLSVPKGQRVAVIGRSGAGKSTLLDLVRGAASPSAGTVCVAGSVGIVEQAPYVFRKSLRENLLLADPAADDDALARALAAVGLDGLLASLPQGLDTPMAEGGITLSGGERHRLALARILLADYDIVLLDEPYRGLDSVTEREVSRVMLGALAGKTIVVVTHNLQDIQAYDRVLILGEGGIEADGAPDELARTDERFHRLLSFERTGEK